MFQNNGVLILGASGLIGRNLYNLLKDEENITGTYNQNKSQGLMHFDISNSSLNTLPTERKKYGIICSAVTKLDKCKENAEYSNAINVYGTKKILKFFSEREIIPVFLSSASVFDGITGNYKEESKKSPTTLYGKQKAEIEYFITENIKDYLIIRPGKVFGIKKGEDVLFTKWLEDYENDREIVCASDEKISPTYALDVARGIKVLMEINARGIFNINPMKHYSRYEMAKKFFKYLDIKDARIKKCSIDDFDFKEKRPKNTYLDASKFIKKTGFRFKNLEKCFDLIAEEFKISK